jgi:hypothetical protein
MLLYFYFIHYADIVVCFIMQIVMNKTLVKEITCSNYSCFLNYDSIAIKKTYTSVTLNMKRHNV